MTPEELRELQTAVLTIADPTGNWYLGWKELCRLAGLDHKSHEPPFKKHPWGISDPDKSEPPLL